MNSSNEELNEIVSRLESIIFSSLRKEVENYKSEVDYLRRVVDLWKGIVDDIRIILNDPTDILHEKLNSNDLSDVEKEVIKLRLELDHLKKKE